MRRTRRDLYKLRRLRLIVQLLFLAILILLLVNALFRRVLGSRIPLLIVTGSTVLLTVALGRVWCGWVCPVGTLLYWTRFKSALERGARLSQRWRLVKYFLLALRLPWQACFAPRAIGWARTQL